MKIVSLSIRNFRSIQTLDWTPGAPFVCLLGKGDIGKSTVLDAIEAVLSPKRMQFFDTDFFNCKVENTIEITANIGDLPDEAVQEGRMGMHLRGWSAQGTPTDEPKKDGETIVTVKLTVEHDLDPRWELITERHPPKPVYSRDRAMFGLVRLGAETDAHLTWGQYSHLARLCDQKSPASNALTKAFRQAKQTVKKEPLNDLNDVAKEVRKQAIRLGAYNGGDFEAGLDTQRLLSSLSGLTLHSVDIPLRMSGLGSKRLTALAVQRLSVPEGAIVLIDELEHGLEPHRIRHALKTLKDEVADGQNGQVILTTHSSTTIVELTTQDLGVAVRKGGALSVARPAVDLQRQLRVDPEAFLSRRVVVSEGKTELGMMRPMRGLWASRHDDIPLAFRGVVFADGSGSTAGAVALGFARLGYETSLFRDADVPLGENVSKELEEAGVELIEWPDQMSTEQRLFSDVSATGVQALLEIAYDAHGQQRVLEALAKSMGKAQLPSSLFAEWYATQAEEIKVRAAIADTAMNQQVRKDRTGWFKNITLGDKIGRVAMTEISSGPVSPLTQTIDRIEAWAYAG